jgi:group II intron reverse transcriptase/maturase
MERVCQRPNLIAAFKRVKRNRGSPGIDGMSVEALPDYLREHWPALREQLLDGTYQPAPVKRQSIPKGGGKMRELGIPTVLDRFIQQALLQVLQADIDPSFSEHSYGFRPRRRAHDAIDQAQRYIQAGRNIVVDIDLEKFFDRVNHDVLMGKLAKRVDDRRVLRLIRRTLNAGILSDGVVVERHQGTPQGGPLSPLLANILLDDIDQALERRKHAFVRYADDLRVFVCSRRAGERVMRWLTGRFGKLRLKVNQSKSAVDRATNRAFLGYAFGYGRDGKVKCQVARRALEAMKQRVRRITRRNRGRSIAQVIEELGRYLIGWKAYFRKGGTRYSFDRLDRWIRRRLRALHLKHWKRGRTAYRELRALGATQHLAAKVAKYTQRWWWASQNHLQVILTKRYFDELGVPRLAA